MKFEDPEIIGRKAAALIQLEEANRRVFVRECVEAGIPITGVSSALLKTLKEQNQHAE